MCEFFFFKQKTAYEMRISDWSSDVCSSDLFVAAVELVFEDTVPPVLHRSGRAGQRKDIGAARDTGARTRLHRRGADRLKTQPPEQLAETGDHLVRDLADGLRRHVASGHAGAAGGDDAIDHRIVDPGGESRYDRGRSEERRDGNGGCRTVKSRWLPD